MRTTTLAAAGLGWFGWTLAEYLLHRHAFHHRPGLGIISSEHRAHHRDPLATSLPLRLTGHVAVAAASGVVPARWRRPSTFAAWVGFAGGYSVYETTHWRIHHRRSTVNAHRVHHHEVHHFAKSAANFGVTVDWWDRVFGTRTDAKLTRSAAQRQAATSG